MWSGCVLAQTLTTSTGSRRCGDQRLYPTRQLRDPKSCERLQLLIRVCHNTLTQLTTTKRQSHRWYLRSMPLTQNARIVLRSSQILSLLVYRLSTVPMRRLLRWWLLHRRLPIPPLRRPLVLHRYWLRSTTGHLLLHVRSVLDVLIESANVAGDVVVGFKAERDERNEAQREPSPVACVSACKQVCCGRGDE